MEEKNIFTVRGSDGNIITFEAHTALSSTVKTAREYAKNNYPDRYVVFSENQLRTKATGNKGDVIETEKGLFMSLILRPSFFPSQAALLGAMSAVATVTGLEEHTDCHLGIGWVSDIYCEGEKIGSTSIEGKLDNFTTYEYLIVSFALRLDRHYFPPRLTDMIKEVFESNNSSITILIAKNILSKFFSYYPTIKSSSKFMDEYSERFILRSRKVKYLLDGKRIHCKVLGINATTGAIRLELPTSETVDVTSPSLISTPKKIKIKTQKA